MSQLEQLKALYMQTTTGDWKWYEWDSKPPMYAVLDPEGCLVTGSKYGGKIDHQFIALMHTMFPRLVNLIEAQEELIIALRERDPLYEWGITEAEKAVQEAKDELK